MHQAGHASLGLQKRLLSRQITSIETTSCKGRLRSLLAEAVEAQRARAGEREIQVDEAEKDRQFALIQQLVEVSRSVGHEVRERHFPRQDERDRASEEPDENQRATDHLVGLFTRPVARSEEHTSELQSLTNLVCRLLLEKKNNKKKT